MLSDAYVNSLTAWQQNEMESLNRVFFKTCCLLYAHYCGQSIEKGNTNNNINFVMLIKILN